MVLDTNTVMALWMFEDPSLTPLRAAVEAGRLEPVTRADALEELRRVLAYRQFALAPAVQEAILTQYRMRCSVISSGLEAGLALPVCRDTDDQKFLEIARDAQAECLVSRDKALLRLSRHRRLRALYRIVTPEAFCASLVDAETAGGRA